MQARTTAARPQTQRRSCAAAARPRSRAVAARAQQEQQQQHVQPDRRQLLLGAAAAAGAALGARPAAAAAATASVPRAQLTPDLSVSRVIKGNWQLSGGHTGERDTDRTSGDKALADLSVFFEAGITTWDCADHYGPAEQLIGRWLAANPEARAGVQVATKVCYFSAAEMAGLSQASVRAAVERSQRRLGMERIDLMQLYWGDYGIPRFVDAALYLTDLQAQGVLGAVGATNFDVPRLQQMLDAGAGIVSHQVQYSLLDRRPQNGMADFCAARNVKLLPYGVVAGGFLTDRYLGVSPRDVAVNTYSKGKYASVLGQAGGWSWLQELLGVLRRVADKHGSSIANVAARWVLQRPGVPAVLLGARNASHVPDHAALFSFALDAEDEGAIADVLARGRQARSDCYTWERGGQW